MPKISPKTEKKKGPKKVPKKEKIKKVKEKKVRAVKKTEAPILEKKEIEKYWEAVGRRKTSIARARLFTKGEKVFLINGKPYKKYFSILELWQITEAALSKMNALDKFRISVRVRGGGYHSQAEAVRHAIARALIKFNPNFRKRLKRVGYLTRDPRMRERKKFGLKRARRAPQWKKR